MGEIGDTEYTAKAAIEFAIVKGWREEARILLNADLALGEVYEPDSNFRLATAELRLPAPLYVAVKRIFREDDSIRERIAEALNVALASEGPLFAGDPTVALTTTLPYEGWREEMAARLEGAEPTTNQAQVSASVREPPFEWNGLRFLSRTETRIAEALSQANVMFFPLPAAVAGVQKKEPDFLICADGKWGILEVQGDQFHPPETAAKEHDRARWFKKYGVKVVEIYDATRCYSDPEGVVEDFLRLLRAS